MLEQRTRLPNATSSQRRPNQLPRAIRPTPAPTASADQEGDLRTWCKAVQTSLQAGAGVGGRSDLTGRAGLTRGRGSGGVARGEKAAGVGLAVPMGLDDLRERRVWQRKNPLRNKKSIDSPRALEPLSLRPTTAPPGLLLESIHNLGCDRWEAAWFFCAPLSQVSPCFWPFRASSRSDNPAAPLWTRRGAYCAVA